MTEKNYPDIGAEAASAVDGGKRVTPPGASSIGHEFLMSMSRLFQLVRIHLPNNRLVVDSIKEFRRALHEICLSSDGANIRVYRGRIYLNQEKVNFDSTMMVAANKLMEYLQAREIQGIRMYDRAELTNDDVVLLITLLNQAGKVKDPVAWLQVELDKANQSWVELQAELENKDVPVDSGLASLSSIAAAYDEPSSGEGTARGTDLPLPHEPEEVANAQQLADAFRSAAMDSQQAYGAYGEAGGGPAAGPDGKPGAGTGPGSGGSSLSDLARRTYAQVMASMARKTYAHALTSILSMSAKSGVRKKVGIQKSKRVVQGMIEILTKDESILLGMSTIRNYDDYTYTHSVNVAILAMCIGRRLGLSRHLVEQLGLCGLFHDLGKVDVPIELISKTSKLSEDEYEKVKSHSINSVRQIIRLNADHTLKSKLVLPPFEHHLGIDLSGYPQSDRRVPVSLLGRILAVADHYDAMTSSRSYRKVPISPDVALKIMMEEAGTVLDPVVLKIFIEMMGVYPVGSLLVLDTKEVALAARTPEDADNGRPIVCILSRGRDNKIRKSKYLDLGERHPETGEFLRNINQCFHPSVFGIQPADFLV